MLKGIPKILSPELLKVLCEMGHSDRIVIGDGNFPAESMGKNAVVIRCDGHGVPELLDAILQVFPLDTYVEHPVNLMEVMAGDTVETPIWDTYDEIVAKYDDRGPDAIGNIERFQCGHSHRRERAVCECHAAERRCDRLSGYPARIAWIRAGFCEWCARRRTFSCWLWDC